MNAIVAAKRVPSQRAGTAEADVTLVLEGTYPYVAGGVSSWVHELLRAFPDRLFSLLHVGPQPGAYAGRRYDLPANVVRLGEVYCRGRGEVRKSRRSLLGRLRLRKRRGPPARMLRAMERLHLDDTVDAQLLADLSSADLSLEELLYGDEAYRVGESIYQRLCPDAPFLDFFWHFRAMHAPLLRMVSAPCPEAATYHAASAGYAGLVGALASYRRRRPFILTEHGIYAREREMELSRAAWLGGEGDSGEAARAALRRLWSHHFQMLSRIAYYQATMVLALSETNRRKQVEDGADPDKTHVVPNGVDLDVWRLAPRAKPSRGPLRVGFVGRVVPIKDILTLIRACSMARQRIDLEVSIIGPTDEDPAYAERCRELTRSLGLEGCIEFLGPRPVKELYPDLDVVVLSSLSEGQPLVILEAHSAGVPVIATDVGACRELLEGKEEDRDLGPSGIVTRIANPDEIAAALVALAQSPEIREAMGQAGRARVERSYQLQSVIARYGEIYGDMIAA